MLSVEELRNLTAAHSAVRNAIELHLPLDVFADVAELQAKYAHVLADFDAHVRPILHEFAAYEKRQAQFKAYKGSQWTNAPSMSDTLRDEVVQLWNAGSMEGINEAIVAYYREDDCRVLQQAAATWPQNTDLQQWQHIISDALSAHMSGHFTLVAPALVPIIEYQLRAWQRALRAIGSAPRVQGGDLHTRLVRSALGDDPGEHAANVWFASATLYHYLLERLYAPENLTTLELQPLGERRPTRHAICHGVLTHYDREAESLRILTALDAMAWLGSA